MKKILILLTGTLTLVAAFAKPPVPAPDPLPPAATYFQFGATDFSAHTVKRAEIDEPQVATSDGLPIILENGGSLSTNGHLLFELEYVAPNGDRDNWIFHFNSSLAGIGREDKFLVYHRTLKNVAGKRVSTGENLTPSGSFSSYQSSWTLVPDPFFEGEWFAVLGAAAIDFNGGKIRFNSVIP